METLEKKVQQLRAEGEARIAHRAKMQKQYKVRVQVLTHAQHMASGKGHEPSHPESRRARALRVSTGHRTGRARTAAILARTVGNLSIVLRLSS